MTWHLVKPGGAILAMKGAAAMDEIKEAKRPKDCTKIELHEIETGDLEPARLVEVRRAG
jgi:16S rRNA G527 N7-methylase RsmG